MKVKLTYFKPNGKYYSSGNYMTTKKDLYDIWEEVEHLQEQGRLPDFGGSARHFIISVDIPGHQHEHPHLIIPQKGEENERIL